MSDNQILEALGQPFPYSDVHWRLQYVDTTNWKALQFRI